MTEEIKIGTVLQVKGVENVDELFRELAEVLKDVNKIVGDTDWEIKVNKESIEKLDGAVQGFHQAIKDMATQTKKLEKIASDGITVGFNDGDIDRFAEKFAAVMAQVLQGLSNDIKKLDSAAKNVRKASGQSETSTQSNTTNAGRPLGQVTQVREPSFGGGAQTINEAVRRFQQQADTIRQVSQRVTAAYEDTSKDLRDVVKNAAFAGLANFEQNLLQDVRKAGKEIQRFAAASLSDAQQKRQQLIREAERLQASGDTKGAEQKEKAARATQNLIDAQVRQLNIVEAITKRSEVLIDTRKKLLQVERKNKVLSDEFVRGQARAREALTDPNIDTEALRTVTKEFEHTSQKQTFGLKKMGDLWSELQTEILRTGDTIEKLEADQAAVITQLAKTRSEDKKGPLLEELRLIEDRIDLEKDALAGQRLQSEEIDGQIDLLREKQAATNETQRQLRSQLRVREENTALIERAQKNAVRLKFEYGAIAERLKQVRQGANASDNFFNITVARDYKDEIRKISEGLKAAKKNAANLRQAQAESLDRVKNQELEGSGAFADIDTSTTAGFKEAQKLAEGLENAIRNKFGLAIEEADQKVVEFNQKLADVEQEASGFIRASSQLEKLKDNLLAARDDAVELGKQFNNVQFAPSTADGILRAADNFDQAQKKAASLEKKMNSLRAEVSRLRDEGAPTEELFGELIRTEKALLQVNEQLKDNGLNIYSNELKVLAGDVAKGQEAVKKFEQELARQRIELRRAEEGLKGTNQEVIVAADNYIKVGTAAKSSAKDIRKLIFAYENLERQGIDLSNTQQQELARLRRLRSEYDSVAVSVKKNSDRVKDAGDSAANAGNGWDNYVRSVRDSIVSNFKFINGLTIVIGGLQLIRTAFSELIEESRAFARTLTVMQSDTKDLGQIFSQLKDVIRETAIEFGERVEDVAEVVKQFGSAGFTAEEAMDGLNSTMQLIISTQANAEEAARSIAGIYRVFGSQLKETRTDMEAFETINDVLISVYRNHQAELDELTQGFTFASATAKTAGFTFQETAAFLAVLNDNMIKSGKAGRGLQVILAQAAKKSDQFAEALNVEGLDPNLPLAQQFIQLLGEVNQQLATGQRTTAELETAMRLFGLRGTKSFLTLVEQFDDLNATFDELENKSEGIGNQLSNIVKGELVKQFESAKQALLDIVRLGVEPLKGLIVILGDLAKGARDFVDAMGPLITGFSSSGILIAGLTIIIGSFIALKATLSAVKSELAEQVASNLRLAKSYIGVTVAQKELVAAKVQDLAITKSGTTANTIYAASANLVGQGVLLARNAVRAFYTAIGGPVGLIFILAEVIILSNAFGDSVRNLKRDLSGLSDELRSISSDMAELNQLSATLVELQNIEGALGADRLLQEVNGLSDDLIDKNKILSRSQRDIADNLDDVVSELQLEIKAKEKILELTKEQNEQELKRKQRDLFGAEIEGSFFGQSLDLFSLRFAEATEGGLVEGFKRYLSNPSLDEGLSSFAGFGARVAGATGFDDDAVDLSGLANSLVRIKELRSQLARTTDLEQRAEIQRLINNRQNFIQKAEVAFVRGLADADLKGVAEKQLSRLNVFTTDEIATAFAERVRNLSVGGNEIELASVKFPDEVEETLGRFDDFIQNLDQPVDSRAFDDAIRSITRIKNEAAAAQKNVLALSAGSGQSTSSLSGGPFDEQFTFDPKRFSGAINATLSQIPKTGARKKTTSNLIAEFIFGADAETATGDFIKDLVSDVKKRLGEEDESSALSRIISEQLVGDAGSIDLQGAELLAFAERIATAYAQTDAEFEQIVESILGNVAKLEKELVLEKLVDEVDKLTKGLERQARAQNSLNSVISTSAGLSKQRQNLLAEINARLPDDEGITSLSKALPTVTDQLDKITKTRLENTKASTEQKKEALEEANELSALGGSVAALEAAYRKFRVERLKSQQQFAKNGILLRQQLRGFQSQLATQVQSNAVRQIEVRQRLQVAQAAEELVTSETASKQFLAEAVSIVGDLVERYQELNEFAVEFATTRLDTLATIEEQLNAENELAGTFEKVASSLVKVNSLQRRLNSITENDLQANAERLDIRSQMVAELSRVLEIEKQIKKAREENNIELLDTLGTIEKIISKYGAEQDATAGALKTALEEQFDVAPFETAAQIAEKLGTSAASVLATQSQSIDRLVEGLREGRLQADGFSGSVGRIADNIQRTSESQREFIKLQEDQLDETIKNGLGRALSLANQGRFDAAKAELNEYSQAVEKRFADNFEKQVQLYREELQATEAINDIIDNENQKINIEFNIVNGRELELIFSNIRDSLSKIREDLGEVSNLNFENLNAVAKLQEVGGGLGLPGDELGKLTEQSRLLTGTIKNLIDLIKSETGLDITKAVGYKDGGSIPGYGGGDTVPALLEKGEFVIPKEMVRRYGMQFFESIRQGRVPKFQEGGSVNGGNSAISRLAGITPIIQISDLPLEDKLEENTKVTAELSATIVGLNIANTATSVAPQMSSYDEAADAGISLMRQADDDARNAIAEAGPTFMEQWEASVTAGRERVANDFASFMIVEFTDAMSEAVSSVGTILDTSFVPAFANSLAEVREQYINTLLDIEIAFKQNSEAAETQLKRNETSYYSYLNSIEDAEKQRLQARLDAQKRYREAIEETSQQLESKFTDAFSVLSEQGANFSSLMSTVGDDLGNIIGGTGAIGTIVGQGVRGIANAVGYGAQGAAAVGSSIAGQAGEGTDRAGFIADFIEGIPTIIDEFAEEFVNSIPIITEGLVENLPDIIDALVENIPIVLEALVDGLGDVLPVIVDKLASSLPQLIQKLVPIFFRLLNIIIDQLPVIVQTLVESFTVLVFEVIRNLPELIFNIIPAILEAVVRAIGGFFSGIGSFLGFQDGGMIPGYGGGDTVPAMLEKGEFVIPKEAVKNYGPDFFENIRKNRSPIDNKSLRRIQKYQNGGLVGDQRASFMAVPSSGGSSTQVSTTNNITLQPTINGNASPAENRRAAREYAETLDKELAKRVKDRDSRLAKSLR